MTSPPARWHVPRKRVSHIAPRILRTGSVLCPSCYLQPPSLRVKTFAQKSGLYHCDLGSGPSGAPEQCLYLLMLPRPPEIIKWFVSLGSLHPTVPHVCVAFFNFPLYKIWSCLITINQRRDHSLEEKSGPASVSTSGAQSGRSDDNF